MIDKNIKDDLIRFKCTKEQKEEIQKKAKELGLNLSSYCLMMSLKGKI